MIQIERPEWICPDCGEEMGEIMEITGAPEGRLWEVQGYECGYCKSYNLDLENDSIIEANRT